jgi:hypothetical protein
MSPGTAPRGGTGRDEARSHGNVPAHRHTAIRRSPMGRGLLLWLIGIPLPIILLIWLFGGLS